MKTINKEPKYFQVVIDFVSHNGGTNNLIIARVLNGMQPVKIFRGKTAKMRAERYCSVMNIGEDLKAAIIANVTDMAISHLESWKDRYAVISLNQLRLDLNMNHDPSLEIEFIEEKLGRKLNRDENHYVISAFNSEVLRIKS